MDRLPSNKQWRIRDFSEEVQWLNAELAEEFSAYICTCKGYFYHLRNLPHSLEDSSAHSIDFVENFYILVADSSCQPTTITLYTPTDPYRGKSVDWSDPDFFPKIKAHLRKYVIQR